MEHEVDAVDGGSAQSLGLVAPYMDSAAVQQLLIELLQVAGGQLLQSDASNSGDGVAFNHQFIPIGGGGAHIGLGIQLVPGAQPGCHGVFLTAAYIQPLTLCYSRLEFLFYLGLGLAQYILDDPLAGLGIVPGGVPAFPPAILSLSNISFAVGSFLCHLGSPPIQ